LTSRLNSLSVSDESYKDLLWDLNYGIDCLISSIIHPDDRDKFYRAKEVIIQHEYLKLVKDPTKYQDVKAVKADLKEDEIIQAGITACKIIKGELMTYYDRYFGFEQRLEVMR
jgi:hypothetical protein